MAHIVYHPDNWPKEYDFEEYCPFCDEMIPAIVDVNENHLEAVCPMCGNRLMLCTMCNKRIQCGDGDCIMTAKNKGWNYYEEEESE